MGISLAVALLIYIPIAGLVMLANIRERQRMQYIYARSVAELRVQSMKRGRLR